MPKRKNLPDGSGGSLGDRSVRSIKNRSVQPRSLRIAPRPAHRRFFPKSEIDLTSTASVRVRRVDGEDLQLRVKLAYCPTEANGRV
jgi:hypothetical protein